MGLGERKLRILHIIIEHYTNTGEPVGSRTISKTPGLGISPATIRNEMADLEEMGYILQPHTSAGRIPTDKGYRLYVDQMLQTKLDQIRQREAEFDEKEADFTRQTQRFLEKMDQMQGLLNRVANVLAERTNYTTMITAPQRRTGVIKFVQLSQIDAHRIILVCVLEGNVIKNRLLEVDEMLHPETLLKLNMLLNTHLNGVRIDAISMTQIMRLREAAGQAGTLMMEVLQAMGDILSSDGGLEIYSGGTSNILKYPELRASDDITGLLTELMEKEELKTFMSDANAEETGIQIYIGDETRVSSLHNCSIVTLNYDIGDGCKSTIGIIGPKRMDYENVVRNLRQVKRQLDRVFQKYHETDWEVD